MGQARGARPTFKVGECTAHTNLPEVVQRTAAYIYRTNVWKVALAFVCVPSSIIVVWR